MRKTITLTVKLYVKGDSDETIADGLSEMEYRFDSTTDGFEIEETEITDLVTD